jgi:hypothetical protein
MQALEVLDGIYSKQFDRILAALKYLHQSGEGFVRQVVQAGVTSKQLQIGTDVIWKTPDNENCGTPTGNVPMLAWMVRKRSRTTVAIALTAALGLDGERLQQLATLLTKDDDQISKEAFPTKPT